MDSGFDDWVVARTPSLLRFAHTVVGTDELAERAVRTALARLWSAWDRVVRADDPDLRARAFVVDACPARSSTSLRARVPVAAGAGPVERAPSDDAVGSWLEALPLRRRAAAVLSFLEGRSDAEVGDVLGVTEAAARAQLHRALAALPPGLPSAPDARDSLIGAALEARAATAPMHLERARGPVDAPPSRRPRTWLASVAVLVLVVGVAWMTHETRTPTGVITYPSVKAPTSWRVESYDGVQIRVPSTWGWGGAPIRADYFHGKGLGSCGSNEAAVASEKSGSSYVALSPFVGRPAVMTDRCMSWGADGVMPSGDAVWLGSPLPLGIKPLGGVIAETRAMGGQHVTVFSGDPKLRRQVLGTVQAVGVDANGCPTQAVQQPAPGPAHLDPTSLAVCVYSQDTGVPVLLWSGHEDATVARRYVAAFTGSAGGTHGRTPCASTPSGQWVALGVSGGGEDTRWDIVNLECSRIIAADQTDAPLTVDTVSSWATGGIKAYVAGPRSAVPAVAAYFRGTLG